MGHRREWLLLWDFYDLIGHFYFNLHVYTAPHHEQIHTVVLFNALLSFAKLLS